MLIISVVIPFVNKYIRISYIFDFLTHDAFLISDGANIRNISENCKSLDKKKRLNVFGHVAAPVLLLFSRCLSLHLTFHKNLLYVFRIPIMSSNQNKV